MSLSNCWISCDAAHPVLCVPDFMPPHKDLAIVLAILLSDISRSNWQAAAVPFVRAPCPTVISDHLGCVSSCCHQRLTSSLYSYTCIAVDRAPRLFLCVCVQESIYVSTRPVFSIYRWPIYLGVNKSYLLGCLYTRCLVRRRSCEVRRCSCLHLLAFLFLFYVETKTKIREKRLVNEGPQTAPSPVLKR